MSIVKNIVKQFKLHPIIISVFILAFYISTLIVSGTVSIIKGFIDSGA